ncbi:MAG: glycerol-3-phosphate 1-O-acyltransferase PlsY [Brockia lithotrophica]|nr:glycerol-3-phosphate 1-O-acyltransferase PlsY [Brockia lithotrophica]
MPHVGVCAGRHLPCGEGIFIRLLFGLVAAYLLGGIPFSYLWVKLLRGIDVRTCGSGNVGATNAYRCGGFLAAVLAVLCDVGKGYLAVLLFAPLSPAPAYAYAVGAAAILGHVRSPFLGFRGGKAVATSLGVLLAFHPWGLAVAAAAFVLALLFTRRMSVASMAAAVAFALVAPFSGRDPLFVSLSFLLAFAILWLHRGNVVRLMEGREPKLF